MAQSVVRGVLIDWAGVLTTALEESIDVWLRADRVDARHYHEVMRELIDHAYAGSREGENIIHALERGEISALEFEQDLARRLRTLDGGVPDAQGMLTRMFAGFTPIEAMHDMLIAAREAGLKTCLISNSWGNEYVRHNWDRMFDAVVISGELGMRKPEPRIFQHALGLVGLTAEQCVFIDDIRGNVEAARSLGMLAVHHRDAASTIAELEALTGASLAPSTAGTRPRRSPNSRP